MWVEFNEFTEDIKNQYQEFSAIHCILIENPYSLQVLKIMKIVMNLKQLF